MKKLIYILMLGIVFTSCEDFTEVETPDFNVALAGQTTINAGDEVDFNLTGDPSIVTFYSGEVLSDFDFITGRVIGAGELEMSFETNRRFGSQQDQLAVLVSTDFNGNYDEAGVNGATWIDITDRFALSTGSGYVATQGIISDLAVEGSPIYISFRYRTLPQGANGSGRTWDIENFLFTADTDIGLVELGDQRDSGFTLVEIGDIVDSGRSSISTSRIRLRANRSAAGKEITTNWWAVSKAFIVGSKDLGPDKGFAIKGYADELPDIFTHTYEKPGTYKATFIGANSTIYGEESVLKTIDITVN